MKTIILCLFLGGCATGADKCGYTWYQATEPQTYIQVNIDKNWKNYPCPNPSPDMWGCTAWGDGSAYIFLRQAPKPKDNDCAPSLHEMKHALGFQHKEPHSYTPEDQTE